MRRSFFPVAPILLLTLSLPVYAGPEFAIDDAWMQRQITSSPSPLSVDDSLLFLSKSSSANFLADVTSVEKNSFAQPYANREKSRYEMFPNSLLSVLGNFSKQAKLTYYRTDAETLVFWLMPDQAQLVEQISAYRKQLDSLPRLDKAATLSNLQEFFAHKYEWKVTSTTVADKTLSAQGVDAFIPLADLPEDVRSGVEAELYAQACNAAMTPSYKPFDAAFWQDARVQVIKGFGPDYLPIIQISQPDTQFRFGVGIPSWRFQGELKRRTPTAKASTIAKAKAKAKADAEKSRTPTIPQTAPVAVEVPHLDLSGEAALQKQVSFSVKRSPLSAFVADLQKQSGVSLKLAPVIFDANLITASSAGMTLSKALRAIGRLYNAHWDKDGNGYTLVSDNLDELHQRMGQMGYGAFYQWSSSLGNNEDEQTQLADEVSATFDRESLTFPKTAPFSGLSPDVQERIIQDFRAKNGAPLITAQQRLDEVMAQVKAQKIRIRLSPLPARTQSYFGAFHTETVSVSNPLSRGATALAAYTADGQFIAPLFPDFSVSKPDDFEIAREKYRVEGEAWAAAQREKRQGQPQ